MFLSYWETSEGLCLNFDHLTWDTWENRETEAINADFNERLLNAERTGIEIDPVLLDAYNDASAASFYFNLTSDFLNTYTTGQIIYLRDSGQLF